ncbi:unnamed protein product [Anisakis simplex]|uniref:D-lactate dehydrogenase (cytochrome) n=1 Tax=Anisakis simplex TaxID=6269 RepID=A0A0M3KCR5_ANISI|nr:unnamed protein product [Anisakis simplex]
MMEMNQIIEINTEDFDCIVQPGVTRLQLNQQIRDSGLFFPVDPGADASVCAMAATCASGTNAIRYELISEFLDHKVVEACNKFSHLTLPEQPTLCLEFDGSTEEEVKYSAGFVADICADNGGSDFQWSYLPEEMDKLWKARHNVYYAIIAQKKGSKGFSTDVCVPISKLADVIAETRKDIDQVGAIGGILGHVGDGNFHCMFACDKSNEEEMKQIWGLSDRCVKRALAVGGTCTGEHGIGLGKRQYMIDEFGEVAVNTMKALKKAIDPNSIMNPGKIF